jgi:hypothetical protein
MGKPELEFHEPAGEWTQVGNGNEELILAVDEETGDYTRLSHVAPNIDTSDQGVQVHDFWEEVFIVRGELTDLSLGTTFTAGMYACRPPGMRHGPWRSGRNGCLMFEVRYGFHGRSPAKP